VLSSAIYPRLALVPTPVLIDLRPPGVRASLIGEGGTEATATLGARPDGRDDEP